MPKSCTIEGLGIPPPSPYYFNAQLLLERNHPVLHCDHIMGTEGGGVHSDHVHVGHTMKRVSY